MPHLATFLVLVGALLTAQAHAADLASIESRQVLRIATLNQLPWHAKQGGRTIGFVLDVGGRLARDLNVRLEVQALPRKQMRPKLEKDFVDLVVGGFSIEAEEIVGLAFSPAIAHTTVDLLVPVAADARTCTPAEIGQQHIVAFVPETEDVARAWFADSQLWSRNTISEVLEALALGIANAAIIGSPWSNHLARGKVPLLKAVGEPLSRRSEAFAFLPRDPAFRRFLTEWVARVEADGFLAERRRYWLEEGKWLLDKYRCFGTRHPLAVGAARNSCPLG